MARLIKVLVALAVLVAAGLAPAQAARRVALVIGNSNYASAGRLANPSKDATALALALKKAGFDDVKLLLNLDYGAMRRALGAFAAKSAGADIALIYYAGHGIEVGGTNYMIPVDARLANADDVEFEAVPLNTVLHAANRAGKLKLVILDACRNNPFPVKSSKRAVGRGLARVDPPGSDTLVAYAAKGGTVAADSNGAGHSPYAAALIKHIATPGLDVRLLFGRIRDDVAASTGGRQEPFTYGSLGGNNIVLVPGNNAAAGPSPAPAPAPAQAPATTRGSEAAMAWDATKSSNSIAVLKAFITRYGDTFYAELARERIKQLNRRRASVTPDTGSKALVPQNEDAGGSGAGQTPEPLASAPQDNGIRQFIRGLYLVQSPSTINRFVERHYTARVNSYGKRYNSRRTLARAKQRYYARFRRWQLNLVPASISTSSLGGGRFEVSFAVDYVWVPRNRARKTLKGRTRVFLVLQRTAGNWRIASERSE